MFQCLKYLKYLDIHWLIFFSFLIADGLNINGSFHLCSEVIIKATYFKGTHNPFSTGNRSPNYFALLYFIRYFLNVPLNLDKWDSIIPGNNVFKIILGWFF